jgi:hypothetical protein
MNFKSIIAFTVIFAFAMAVYALNQNHSLHFGSADCCAKNNSAAMKVNTAGTDTVSHRDDCPMKAGMSESEKASCCDNCPMKDGAAGADKLSHDNCPMKAEGRSSSPDNCPMKKMREKASTEKPVTY